MQTIQIRPAHPARPIQWLGGFKVGFTAAAGTRGAICMSIQSLRLFWQASPTAVCRPSIKTAQELEPYPDQDIRHLAELKAVLDDEDAPYAS